MASNNAVVNAILAATSNTQVQAAMLMGSKLESGWSATAVGDQGTSFGPFQIHLPAHPGVSSAEAENPSWAVNYMLPAYEDGVSKVPASMWSSNPAEAAATAAYYAERPAKMYAGYEALWSQVQTALGGGNVSSGGNTSNASGTGGTSGGAVDASTTSSLLAPLESDISVTLNDMYMGGLMLLGLVMMVVGFVLLFKGSVGLPKAPTINVTVPGGNNGSNSSGGRDSNIGTSGPAANQGTPTATSGRGTAARRGGTTGARGLNTGRAIAGTAVGRSVSVTAGRPKPRKPIMLPRKGQNP
jgi:hypothetical protein